MNSPEDRLPAALAERAEDFPVSPDAWARVQRKAERLGNAGRGRAALRPGRYGKLVVPVAAAASVAAVVLAVAGIAGAGHPAPAQRRSPPATPAPPKPPGPGDDLMKMAPPITRVIRLDQNSGGEALWVYFWVGRTKVNHDALTACFEYHFWTPSKGMRNLGGYFYVAPLHRGQLVTGVSPPVVPASMARDLSAPGMRWSQEGQAAWPVTSVTAVLADGRSFPGVVGAGRGFPSKVWLVRYPWTTGAVRLVFRDASGRDVTRVAVKPVRVIPDPPRRPETGGVPVFGYEYPPSRSGTQGTMLAYLRSGHIEFWTSQGDGPFDPQVPVGGGPVLSGRWDDYLAFGRLEWFGAARADVAKVTVRLADGRTVSAATFHPGWASSQRLFAVRIPQDLYGKGGTMGRPPRGTATAYDASGHVLARVQLGLQ